jgi:hypothetical protein
MSDDSPLRDIDFAELASAFTRQGTPARDDGRPGSGPQCASAASADEKGIAGRPAQ